MCYSGLVRNPYYLKRNGVLAVPGEASTKVWDISALKTGHVKSSGTVAQSDDITWLDKRRSVRFFTTQFLPKISFRATAIIPFTAP